MYPFPGLRNLRSILSLLVVALLAAAPRAFAGIEQAQKYYESGDAKAAVIELKNLLQKDDGDAEARLLLARVYLDTHAGAEAEKELRRAAELGADPARWRLALIDALLMQGKFSEALDRAGALEQGGSGSEKAERVARVGNAYAGLNKPDAARRSFREALELDPANERASLGMLMLDVSAMRNVEEAVPLVSAFLAKFPDNIDALLLSAELDRQRQDFAAALSALDRVLALRPQELSALNGRAGMLIAQGKLQEAKAELDRADAIREGLVGTEFLRGVIAFQEEDFDGAKAHLEQVRRVVPGQIQSQYFLGIIAFNRNELQIAAEYLGSVVSAMPGNVEAARALAATRIRLGQPGKAVELLEPLASQSGDAHVMALLGSAYLRLGESDKGQEWLTRAVEAAPDVAALRTSLASALLAGGETEQAVGELQAAVKLGDDTLQADALLVLVHLKNEQLDEALNAALELEARKPDEAVPLNLTGLTHLVRGDLGKAAERFEKALAADPDFTTAEVNLARVDIARGDMDAAQRRMEGLLARRPGNVTALMNLAVLAERRGDTKELVARLQEARKADPAALGPGLALANHYLGSAQGVDALAAATDLAARFPDNPAVLSTLARAQILSGDTASALSNLERLAEKHPENTGVMYLMGAAKWKAGDLAGADLAFERATRLDPKNLEARQAWARVALAQGRMTEALDAAKKLQQDLPDARAGWDLEGEVYLRLNRPELAAEAYEAANALKRTGPGTVALARAYAAGRQQPKAIAALEAWLAEQPGTPRP